MQTCLKPRKLANRYQEYENEGATVWDRTVDVRKRPAWLRDAASKPSNDDSEDDTSQAKEQDEIEIDLFSISSEANPEFWDGSQVALNEAQLSNRQDLQWQQLEVMRQRLALQSERIEQQHAEQVQQQAEQLEKLQQLQMKLTEQHVEQQQTVASAISATGARECYDDGKCITQPTCLSAEV